MPEHEQTPAIERMRTIAELLTQTISQREPDGMPVKDLGWALYQAAHLGAYQGDALEERIRRLGGAYITWADGHYTRIDQDERDRWLVAGISRTRRLVDYEPDIEDLCTLAASLLTHVLQDRATSIMKSIDNSLLLAGTVDGETESHAAVGMGLRCLMQILPPADQRLAMAEGLNLVDVVHDELTA